MADYFKVENFKIWWVGAYRDVGAIRMIMVPQVI